MKIVLVAAARPNFPKIAPIAAALRRRDGYESVVVHTGQHYDYELSGVFFEELELGPPDHFLQASAEGGRAVRLADVVTRFDAVLADESPDLVLVVGDVDSTVACSVGASYRDIPVAHVEAGLRSGDRRMPEEINRVATDAIADLLFTTDAEADANLRAERVPEASIHRVGNVMIDTLLHIRPKAAGSDVLTRYGLQPRDYVLVTMHRPSNVDDPTVLTGLVDALIRVSASKPILFPVHPRTRSRLDGTGMGARLEAAPGIHLVEPQGYVDMLCLMDHAALALVDSGGIQEETTVLGVPCLTMRHNTERPITITEGTNQLVGTDPERIVTAAETVMRDGIPPGRVPDLWDGAAAERIVDVLERGITRRQG